MIHQQGQPAKSSRHGQPGERIILGIDPGTTIMGFGVLRAEGRNLALVEVDVIRFPAEDDHTLKLRAIFRQVAHIIEKHRPDELAIESQFFGKNVQSMLKLGRAQGVAIAAALQQDIPVVEYAPKRVKQSVTGNGNATKEQVSAMLLSILGLKELPHSTATTKRKKRKKTHRPRTTRMTRTMHRPVAAMTTSSSMRMPIPFHLPSMPVSSGAM